MSVFLRLRRLRKLLVLVALVWLPLSVYAQVCTTQVAVMAIGGADHPGMPQPGDHEFVSATHHGGHADAAVVVVVDADTFWRTIDSMDSACDMKALCAFAGLAAITANIDPVAPPTPETCNVLPVDARFVSRDAAADTPPPRLAL